MHHVAIMKKSLGFLSLIRSGQKTIESRWMNSKTVPWKKVNQDDLIWFKNSCENISIRATVEKVIYFENLNDKVIKSILEQYWQSIGLDTNYLLNFYPKIENKKYGILIFLNNTQVTEPIKINKNGYGQMSAWISVNDINQLIYT